MKFLGYILIFSLLLLTNIRVFFIRKAGFESLVVLGPFSLLLSIVMVFAWGLDMYNFCALLLGIFVTLTNFHALIRFNSHLYIDHFSNLMKFWAIITTIISVLFLIFSIIFFPVQMDSKKMGISEKKIEFQGNFEKGFIPATTFSQRNLTIYEYTKFPDFTNRRNVAVLIADKRGDSENYKPFLQFMAKKAITVCSADFYTKDSIWFNNIADSKILRKTSMLYSSIKFPEDFASLKSSYTYKVNKELEALLPELVKLYGEECKFFLISDGMTNTAVRNFAAKNNDKISGCFALDTIPEYKTAGYGCVEQTNPFLAVLNGSKKDFKFTIPELMAAKVAEISKSTWLKK